MKQPIDEKSDDFRNLINLMSVFSESTHRVSEMESAINSELLNMMDEMKKEYSDLQRAMTEAETAIELIARRHPEWFKSKKSVATPYGTLSFRKTTKLEVPNEEASVLLVEQADDLPSEEYLRQETTLNLEALEKLDDAVLRRLRIRRVTDDSFSVKAARVNIGKAVKEAAEKGAA